MLLAVAVAAVGFAGLAYPTIWWSSVISSAVLCLLSYGFVAAILHKGRSRAFWTGFAFFGWMYLIVQFVRLPTIDFHENLFLPEMVMERIEAWRYPDSNRHFDYIGTFLSALMTAYVGGFFARFFYNNSSTNADQHP